MQKCFKFGLCLIAKCGAVILVEKKKAFALKSMGRWLFAQLLCDLSDPTQGLTLSVLTFLLHRTKIVVLPQWQTWQRDPFLFKCSNSRCSYPLLHKMENAKWECASHPLLPWEGWSYFDVLVKKTKEPIQGFNDQLIATSEFNIIHIFDNLFRGADSSTSQTDSVISLLSIWILIIWIFSPSLYNIQWKLWACIKRNRFYNWIALHQENAHACFL